jgi:uncharacterized protein (TIGR02246 family)
MRGLVSLSFALIFVLASLGHVAAQKGESDEQQLRQLQNDLTTAWAKKDKATIERLLAPEWSLITADGSILTRADAIKFSIDSGEQTISQMTVDQVSVTIYGDAAVVRGRVIGTGATLRGGAWTAKAKFTDLCIRKSGRWQVVASQQSNSN